MRYFAILTMLGCLSVGCDGDDSGDGGTGGAATGGTGGSTGGTGGGAGSGGASCGPTELCKRTIDECKEPMTQATCEGWYATASNCKDMAAYTQCNCGCIGEATCSDYFACGQLCFNDSCK